MNQDVVKGPINIGNPNEFTMLELAEHILAKVGGKSKLVFQNLPGDDPKQRQHRHHPRQKAPRLATHRRTL